MPLDDLTDEEIMAMYQNGSEKAFQVLYARHSSKVYGFLKSRIRQNENVADIFQDVFIKIHRSKHLYNKSLPVLPWIFTITKSVMIDAVRKNKKSEVTDTADFDKIAADTKKSFVIEEAASIIQQLPKVQQMAVHLRYVDDKTFEEIAESLNVSSTNVRKIISRGVLRLKQLMNQEGKS